MRGEVPGIERQRQWGAEDWLSIISSVGVGEATVTRVAQRHDVSRQQSHAWRHELTKKGLRSPDQGVVFLLFNPPATGDTAPEPEPVRPGPVELRLSGGRCFRFDGAMDVPAPTRLIRAVETA